MRVVEKRERERETNAQCVPAQRSTRTLETRVDNKKQGVERNTNRRREDRLSIHGEEKEEDRRRSWAFAALPLSLMLWT